MTSRRMFVVLLGIAIIVVGASYYRSKMVTADVVTVSVPLFFQSVELVGQEHLFKGTTEEIKRFMQMNREITLTSSQEAVRVEALSQLPAPCCSESSAATCCCECNLSRTIWGLSKSLIVAGAGATEVREAARAWIKALNPAGYDGDACMKGRCEKSLKGDACGGMDEADLVL